MEKNERRFPDGTPIDDWFFKNELPQIERLGQLYNITEYGIKSDGGIYTRELQTLIDKVAEFGGGIIFVPSGTYYTGALYFKQGVHLYVSKGGELKGSDDISDYPLCKTRIEGESCTYFPALINVDGIDGFTIFGLGVIDGNGLRSWKAFWQRLRWNPNATNKDEQRPRLIYISNSKNITIAGVCMQNSHFWTSHIYKCNHVRFLDCVFYAPRQPIAAPSSDGIDIDACEDVLISGCRFEVNDDGIALKGGKGLWADKQADNGANERILIQNCTFQNCHSCLTCGSESIHNKNILMQDTKVNDVLRLLYLKMRPDTPQRYEYITLENIKGNVIQFICVNEWKQFFDLKGRCDVPLSYANNITIRESCMKCDTYFEVEESEQYQLSDFLFKNLKIKAKKYGGQYDFVKNMVVKDVFVEIIDG